MRPVALLLIALLSWGCARQSEPPRTASKPQGQSVDPRSRVLLVAAHKALDGQELHEALKLLDQVERYNPDLPEALFLRGHVWLAMGRFAEADEAFRSILARFPNYEAAWHSRGDVAFAQDRFRQALEYYRREDELNPTPQTWFNIGNAYRRIERPDSAADAFRRALKLNEAYALAHHALAELEEDKGAFEQALSRAQRALELDPGNVNYMYQTGSLLFQLDRLDDAEAVLRKAVATSPGHYSALYTLGRTLQRKDAVDEANQFLDRAEEARRRAARVRQASRNAGQFRDSSLVHIALAEQLIRAGEHDRALERFNVALALDPSNLTVKQNIASLTLSRGDARKALELCSEILEEDSLRVGAWVIMSAAQARLGNQDASRVAWTRAVRIDPNHPTIQNALSSN